MSIWIGITDNAWFDFLAAMKPDEVNFWHPSGPCSFRVLQPGEIFFFKLKSPRRKIAGWARFVTHFNMPLSLAWRTFESKNGARDFRSFSEMILRHGPDRHPERWIGCTTLNNPLSLSEILLSTEHDIHKPELANERGKQGKRRLQISIATGVEQPAPVYLFERASLDEDISTVIVNSRVGDDTIRRLFNSAVSE